ncbi:YfhO family protein [Staphylococcus sp. 17KM0847]|uniref:YfhO family protein n=1 Tax=Staphylococcus sp. 17KM0847 TaxID=2583989 RepID=UPI0015DC4499|nr:YfhO family protein [Staphylococcus sp. 17KM0847]QLK85858.1 hypothetical protein FGL66_03610 [Staphylococcus sp. 17KM0847]
MNNFQPHFKWFKLLIIALCVGAVVYAPVVYRYIIDGVVYSGNGDGFKQMMPFQMFLYDRFSHFSSLYDISFGLGGDYFTDLSYYYATSPIMYLNFIGIAIVQLLFQVDPSHIDFWPSNQIIVAYFKCVATFLIAYGTLKVFDLSKPYRFLGAFLYSASTILYYFNFTWSFYGDILLYLPLSIWGMERFFKERKIGLFIVAITLTLFSNFYFSYYETLALCAYLICRIIFVHPKDVVSRWQKLWLLCPAVIISLCIASFGFFTGIRSFLHNDRTTNDFSIPLLIDFSQKYHIFTNGFYFTVTFIALVALFSFKLYRHYYYKVFAILTWVMLIGALSPYFDSIFNGFSFPQRRWGYLFTFTTAVLIAMWLKYISELTWQQYLFSWLPIVLLAIATLLYSRGNMAWVFISGLILWIIAYYLYRHQRLSLFGRNLIIGLFIVQQFVLLLNYHTNNIERYTAKTDKIHSTEYHSPKLQSIINHITEHQSPLERIDYKSDYTANTSMLYHFNGISLYSSIFDGEILNYYDQLMQINTGFDSNSTYRLLGDRANLYALWGVSDRIKDAPDHNMTYGMKTIQKIQDRDATWIHAHNTIDYPAAHLATKVFDADDLKSPLDREQAMLQGVVLDGEKANTSFKQNPNLINKATITTRQAQQQGTTLTVTKDNGGLNISLPQSDNQRYKDYYLEMDVALRSPNQPHYLKVDGFYQRRTKLDYQYKRFVTPVTIRVPVKDTMKLKLKKGTYRVNIKGIYGEDYTTLKQAKETVTPVAVERTRRHLNVTINAREKAYLVLPIPYRDGLKAEVDGTPRTVVKGNGLMTVVKVHKGDEKLTVSYELPYWRIYLALTLLGIVSAFLYRGLLRRELSQ